jgi:cell division septal protein FtsQ
LQRLRARLDAFRAAVASFLARRRNGLLLLGRLALAAVLLQAGLVLYRATDRYVRNSPEFAITTLSVEGNARVARDEIEETIGIAVGDNVFVHSPEEIEASLQTHPWIAEAHVRRRLPSSFEIQVRERTPVLLLALGATYLVDEDGTVFKSLEEGDPVDLPVITGVDEARFRSDRSYRTELLTSAIALSTEWSLAGLARRESIAEIHIEANEEITLFVGDDGTEVRLGRGPYRAKLSRFRRVMDELQRRQSRPLYVYLDNVRRPDRVTVRVR